MKQTASRIIKLDFGKSPPPDSYQNFPSTQVKLPAVIKLKHFELETGVRLHTYVRQAAQHDDCHEKLTLLANKMSAQDCKEFVLMLPQIPESSTLPAWYHLCSCLASRGALLSDQIVKLLIQEDCTPRVFYFSTLLLGELHKPVANPSELLTKCNRQEIAAALITGALTLTSPEANQKARLRAPDSVLLETALTNMCAILRTINPLDPQSLATRIHYYFGEETSSHYAILRPNHYRLYKKMHETIKILNSSGS